MFMTLQDVIREQKPLKIDSFSRLNVEFYISKMLCAACAVWKM